MIAPVQLVVVEGDLEEVAAVKLLNVLKIPRLEGGPIINQKGRIKFWNEIQRFNSPARHGVILGLADLEDEPCPSGLIEKYVRPQRHPNLILRLAEPMLESWLLADIEHLSDFLDIPESRFPQNPELLRHPKHELVDLVRHHGSRELRHDIVPPPGSLGRVGKGYTTNMRLFIRDHWDPLNASRRSESLARAMSALQKVCNA